jgi:serine/threonine protein kinase
LKHPNIVELLASYTHQDKHSLLFPRAEHGTLATLFKTPRQDTDFASDATFLTALARLASAIEHIHDFFDHKIDLSLIGCHHDLRPQNILVSGTTLILADFGLSKFKDLFQNSDTSFRLGIGDYLAPECEDLEANFEPRRIRRSSDVWSFGCILAEAVTYMTRGHKAIEQFWNERVVFVRAFKLHLFHNGQNTSSAVVTRWLSMLQQSSESSCVMLITIVRRMLSIDPAGRPKAAEVVSRLRLIALHEQAALIDGLFNRIKQGYDSIDAVIERMRFLAWSRAIGIEEIQRDPASVWHPSFNEDIQFESVHDCLLRIHQDLKQRLQPVQDASYSPLNLLNDHLFHLLGPERQESCRTFFRISVHHTDDTRLRWNGMNDRGLFLEREIRLSTSLKQMITLMENTHITDTSQTQIKSSAVFLDRNKIGEHNTAHLRDGRKTWQVLVEWRKYGRDSADESISRQLFARLNAIVKQLSVKKPESIRALHCRGYFHDESQHAFGILYEIPRQESSADSTSIQNTTLHQWIVETTDKSKYWPVLDDKFRLAYILAKSVLEFHLVGWLHKNLTASNIAFFYPPTASREERTREPYIIGFNHSRPDEPSAFTEGIVKSGVLGYQHPKYRRATRGYRPEYDYYSLGVLLMEVGFWRPIKEIVGFGKTYGEEHDQKLRDRIPQLKQYMGRSYCEAVIACLSDDFNSLRTDDGGRNNKEVFIDFEIKVISRLNNHMVH